MGTITYPVDPVELSTDGPTQVGPFRICANGLVGGHRTVGSRIKPVPERERQPVRRLQVEIVKELFAGCRPTRWARTLLSPMSCDAKHWAEDWGARDLVARGQATGYVSTGAAIIAAIELGLICIPTFKGSRNVFIGIHFDDVAARMAERGWYIAPDHVRATRIKEPEPERPITAEERAFWENWRKENGVVVPDPEPGGKHDPVEMILGHKPDDDDTPPHIWCEIADAMGISIDEDRLS